MVGTEIENRRKEIVARTRYSVWKVDRNGSWSKERGDNSSIVERVERVKKKDSNSDSSGGSSSSGNSSSSDNTSSSTSKGSNNDNGGMSNSDGNNIRAKVTMSHVKGFAYTYARISRIRRRQRSLYVALSTGRQMYLGTIPRL